MTGLPCSPVNAIPAAIYLSLMASLDTINNLSPELWRD